ncbi:BQ5605_C029g10672 [Microbotryum silenes-dioicae]|uniref:BQ5605_C029g10672 protein n=1 Tax=Microbotryum silenes-dioicae TaxID=796604 RepID=A0A2X0MLV8_9BASI|nr:BQ5605_C029g10672 [Microbotryum silenes-dioicae]
MQLLSRFFRKRSADNTDDIMKQLAKLSGARLQQAKVIPSSDNTAVQILIDLWHFFDRIYVSKKHGAAKAFARAFSDAVFIPNADDRLLIKARLAKLGMTWEEAVRSPVWNKKLWRRVRRWIPPPGILEPLVREVFEKLGRCERCLEAIRKGQVSDPVGIELYTDLGPCGGPDGKADDGVRLYSCQRDTNSLEGGIHRNLRQRFPRSGVSPCHVNACTADYVLVHNLTVSPTPPSQFEEAATILTHSPLYSQVGTFNRTGKPFVGHYDLWLTVELHRLRRKTTASFPRHSITVSDIVNSLLYTPSTETFGIVPVVQSPTAQMRFLIEPYQVERGTLRLEPVKWSPRNLLQNNTPAIQHMQSRLPTDRKLRHDWLAERQGTRFDVLYDWELLKNFRILEITELWNKYANGVDIFYKMPEHINTWASRWSSLANAQATMNMGGNDVIVIQALLTDPSRGRDVSMLAAKPLLGHKPPVLGRLTEVEVDFSDPPTSSIRALVATASSDVGSSADLGTSSALTRAGTTKGARHCRLCGQTTCRRKGSKLSDDGSVTECDGACLDCGKHRRDGSERPTITKVL